MDRRRFLAAAGAAGVTGLAGCSFGGGDREAPPPTLTADETSTTTVGGPTPTPSARPPFRVGTDGFERATATGYEPVVVRGVNIGMAKPGVFPGEAAITRAEYDRWLAAIGEIATVIRTYTIHPPAFYRALAAYNATAADPLLLLQGTWVPTLELIEAGDATTQSAALDRALRETVDVLHGDTTLPERRGYASGRYDADVSDATLGLLFGIEWPPEVVAATNTAGQPAAFDGRYLQGSSSEIPPFERWLGGRLDAAVAYETATYDTHRPVGFVNWVTTDPLEHPYEPFTDEDRVSVDPDALVATPAFEAGTFAAYHAYPYYPDLLNETPAYIDYIDHRGEPNSYAGYLNDLIDATDHPLVIAEFGVPSSRGIAHRHVHGRDQGRHTEATQGELVAAMYEDIQQAGAAGGIAFAWQDEWFKRTWNLDARSVPGRRPNWSNIETPEQRFGLLTFEPVDGITLDGTAGQWADATTVAARGAREPPQPLERLHISHDLEGLGLRLAFAASAGPVDWSAMNALITVGLTGRRATVPFGTDATAPADFVIRLAGPDDSQLLVESSYDAFAREFGTLAGLDLAAYRTGDAGFVPVREPISLGYTVPPTGERRPFEAVETGQLRYGTGNPAAETYDSLADVYVAPDGGVIEVKLPWILLNVADPSSKQRIQTDWAAGLDTTEFETLSVGAATYTPAADGRAQATGGPTNLHRAAPGTDGRRLRTTTYGWERWDQPTYQERLKESYHHLRRAGWGADR